MRRARFGDAVVFSAPSFKHFRTSCFPQGSPQAFRALSLTGTECSLSCEHCEGRLLEAMSPATTPQTLVEKGRKLAEQGAHGVLLSGGCDPSGQVPLLPFAPAIAELRRMGLEVAAHGGLISAETALALARSGLSCLMLDLVGSRETARDIIHLDVGPEAFESALRTALRAGLSAVPHIVLGLHRGQLRGEAEALRIAASYPIRALVLVIHRPEPNTKLADAKPPSPEELGRFMARARLTLPRAPIMLGCARPVGTFARQVERYALLAGLNGVAFPSDDTVQLSESMGFSSVFRHSCCALPCADICER